MGTFLKSLGIVCSGCNELPCVCGREDLPEIVNLFCSFCGANWPRHSMICPKYSKDRLMTRTLEGESPMPDTPIQQLIDQMTQWCNDNSGHYHEDDVEEVVAGWRDQLTALLTGSQENKQEAHSRVDHSQYGERSGTAASNEAMRALARSYRTRAETITKNARGCSQSVTVEDMLRNRALTFIEAAADIEAVLDGAEWEPDALGWPAAPTVAPTATAPEKCDESFLRGVVSSSTTYSEGWRAVCARLLWVESELAAVRQAAVLSVGPPVSDQEK